MRTETILDIIFCAFVLPGMVFLFPTGEWLQWQPDYVLGYFLWLLGCFVMGRKALGALLCQPSRGSKLTALGVIFLMGVVTFLMTFTPVNFPETQFARVGEMKLHVRAMWILFLAVNSYAIPVGYLSARLRELTAVKEEEDARAATQEALALRRSEATQVHGGEIQVKQDYKLIHIPLTSIRYVEGRNNYACFHLDHRGDVVSQVSLKAVMEMLPPGEFLRIHRSYIVPLWRIEKRTTSQVQLVGVDEKLPIGRAYKDSFNNA